MAETKKLKILRVAQQVYPKAPGGGAYHVHALSRDQGLKGHDVELLTISKSNNQYKDNHYKVTASPVTAEIFKNQLSIGALKRLVNTEKYDIVHAHSHLRSITNFSAICKYINKTPLLITNHGTHSQSVPYWFSELYNRSVGRTTMNRADVVFSYTEEEKKKLREFGINSRIEVVHNGIDHTRFRPDVDTHSQMNTSGPIILFVGRLSEGKRPQDALVAFDKIRDVFPESSLYMCGDGPLYEELLAKSSKLNCRDSVHFLGNIGYKNMPSIFSAADVLLLTSRMEGFPRVILEALAAETPVVASELEQITNLVEQTGRTAPIGDTDAFAEGIMSLLENEDTRQFLGRRGREIIKEEFSWSETVDEVTKVTEEIASTSRN